MFKNFDFTHLLPTFSPKEFEDIKAYYAFSKEYEKVVLEKADKELRAHPVIGPIMKSIPQEVQDANNKETDRLLREAIFDGKWEPYIKSLMMQGIQYVHMGLDFKAWYDLIAMIRRHYVPIWEDLSLKDPVKVNSIR